MPMPDVKSECPLTEMRGEAELLEAIGMVVGGRGSILTVLEVEQLLDMPPHTAAVDGFIQCGKEILFSGDSSVEKRCQICRQMTLGLFYNCRGTHGVMLCWPQSGYMSDRVLLRPLSN